MNRIAVEYKKGDYFKRVYALDGSNITEYNEGDEVFIYGKDFLVAHNYNTANFHTISDDEIKKIENNNETNKL